VTPTLRAALRSLSLAVMVGAPGLYSASGEDLALRGASVLPMNGEAPRSGQTVLVREGRIAAIGAVDDVAIPQGARIVEASGRYLLPGFADLHVHIKRGSADVDRLLALFLRYGVTTVLNLDGGPTVLALRDEVASGARLGPRVFTAGPIIRGSDSMSREVGESVAREQLAAGYDVLKVYNQISAEGYAGIVAEAKKAGMPVIGHAVRSVGIEGALANGQHIAHMEELVYGWFTWKAGERTDLPEDVVARLDILLDASKVPDLARRVAESGVYVIPNLTAYHHIQLQLEDLDRVLARPEVALMPRLMTQSWVREKNGYMNRDDPERFRRGVVRTFPFLQQLTAAFQAAGVPLLVGTDTGIPVIVAGTSVHDELAELVTAGLTAEQALAAATSNAARFLRDAEGGTLEVGERADLVLLRDDPLREIGNSRSIEGVVVAGRYLDVAALDALLGADP
jgi:imidazolonepropionase-like amidohydrolase